LEYALPLRPKKQGFAAVRIPTDSKININPKWRHFYRVLTFAVIILDERRRLRYPRGKFHTAFPLGASRFHSDNKEN
jgi:hypothetical protein